MSEKQEPKPNLRFSPEALEQGYEPSDSYKDGLEKIVMPSAEVQIKGFYFKDTAKIIRLSGGLIKNFTPEEQAEIDLPVDFPGREVFRKKGLNLSDVIALVEAKKLTEIEGIGDITAQKVEEYLTGSEENNG